MTTKVPQPATSLKQFTGTCDDLCRNLNGALSYCKSWLLNPTCALGDQPCSKCGFASTTTRVPNSTAIVTRAPAATAKATQGPTTSTGTTRVLTTTTAKSTKAPTTFSGTFRVPSSTATVTRTLTSSTVTTRAPSTTKKVSQAATTSPKAAQASTATTITTRAPAVSTNTTPTTPLRTNTTTRFPTSSSVTSTRATQSSSTTQRSIGQTTTSPRINAPAIGCDALCASISGGSYCKTWLASPTCSGSEARCDKTVCGGTGIGSTISPLTTKAANTTTFSSSRTVDPSLVPSSECEQYVGKPVPLFIWIEGPRMYARTEFVAFYKKVTVFLQSNCANIRPTTLVIRTAHPAYVPNGDVVYWPPNNSPLFTELISKLGTRSNNISIMMYPYIYDEYARSQWIAFANSGKVDKVLPRPKYDSTASTAGGVLGSVNIYDGIFQFVKGWQTAVASLGSNVTVDGFVIDYEEVFKYPDENYIVKLSADEINPYRSLYPSIKVATTIGYDDSAKLARFEPYMDYLYLQAYDLYYPFAGADSTPQSIFLKYENDPQGLAAVLLQKVFTQSILNSYQSRLSKVKIMWSTQALGITNCLYKLNDGSCGINYELGSWTPAAFNVLMQTLMAANPILGAVEHGMYTMNFITPDWLPRSARDMP
jgi:hypothetical protein